jgi:Kef-type K+ transport system membrane component KefB
MDPVAGPALGLALVLVAAKLGGHVATRLGQPPVLGELLAGTLLGNAGVAFLHGLGTDASIDMLARLGALVLLFEAGLESTVNEVVAVGPGAARVAVLGSVTTFFLGSCAGLALMRGRAAAVFLGASLTATSVGITARVFKDLSKTRSEEARTILCAAILDDIIGLVVLAIVSAWLTSSAAPQTPASWAWLVVKPLAFLLVAMVVGVRLTPRLFARTAALRTHGALLAIGLAFCFSLSWAADAIGLAPIVGAFAAGLVLEDSHSAQFVARGERSLIQLVEPVSSFLVPVFFVVMGARADMRALFQPAALLLAASLTAAAVLGKLGCGFGAARGVDRVVVGFGMMPRGEVSLIFASLGATLHVAGAPILDPTAYSALVATVIFTTVLTPVALRWAFRRASGCSSDDPSGPAFRG